MRRSAWMGLGSVLAPALATIGAYERYRREMRVVSSRLEAASQIIDTLVGTIEYGRHCIAGEQALVIHGAGGGFDQGLLLGDEILGPGFGIIAPSRFGYLNTPVPAVSSPKEQADAHAALLDALGVSKAIVVGVSAGAPSAIELALRHPQRVSALILVVPRAFAPAQAEIGAPPESVYIMKAVMAGSDFLFWLAIKFVRRAIVRFLGVPPRVEAAAPERERYRVTNIMRNLLPLSRRQAGLWNDSSTVVEEWPLSQIKAPTLVISAIDDLYGTLPAARYTAKNIAGAELVVLQSGGHLMVGQISWVRDRVANFLSRRAGISLATVAA